MEVQTRKTEQIVFAQTTQEMFGKYVAENAIKTYCESYVDSNTGETKQVERHDVLFRRGTRIDENNMDSVEFYLQTHDIEGIYVSDQCRKCHERESSILKVYKAKVLVGIKTKNVYVCQAENVDMAKAIIADYIELTEESDFKFIAISEMACGTILNRNKEEYMKQKAARDTTEATMFPEEELEKQETPEGEQKEEKPKQISYYEISIDATLRELATKAGDKDIINTSIYSFLVEADDADEAKDKSLAWLKLFNKETTIIEGAITLEAKPFKCKKVIDREFVETYLSLPNPSL